MKKNGVDNHDNYMCTVLQRISLKSEVENPIADVFPSVYICNTDMFSLNRFITVKHRYITTLHLFLQCPVPN